MTDLQREQEIKGHVEQGFHLWPDDTRYLLAKLKKARERARYCTQCRSEGSDEVPLGQEVYICFWCGDGFCHEHAAKHFERDEHESTRRELKGAREKLADWEPWMSALGRMLTEHRIARFPDDVLAWREKLAALEELPKRLHHGYRLTASDEWWIQELDRILHPKEGE